MLIRFIVSNFLSFSEETEFSMISGNYKNHPDHVYKAGKVNVLKGTAIYGANGAGKSNLIKAISFFKEIVEEGRISKSIDSKKFKLNDENLETPTAFEIEFNKGKKIYSYGIIINHKTIEEEWLYETKPGAEDKLIFERVHSKTGKAIIKTAPKYSITQKQKILIELMQENLLKENELLLCKSDNLKFKELEDTRDWINYNLLVVYPEDKLLEPRFIESVELSKFTNNLLNAFDTGIKEITVESLDVEKYFPNNDEINRVVENLEPEEHSNITINDEIIQISKKDNKGILKRFNTVHSNAAGKNINFALSDESDGTKRLLDFIPIFKIILNDDCTFIIDEIDRSLHPVLLKLVVQKIMADETTKGQLIFTTHESNMLDMNIFRQDEIWFAEKEKKSSSTKLYSLSEYNPRPDLDIRKGYLRGRFGAVPFLASLEDLNWSSNA